MSQTSQINQRHAYLFRNGRYRYPTLYATKRFKKVTCTEIKYKLTAYYKKISESGIHRANFNAKAEQLLNIYLSFDILRWQYLENLPQNIMSAANLVFHKACSKILTKSIAQSCSTDLHFSEYLFVLDIKLDRLKQYH